jgi:hypothetical protein
MRYGTLSPWTSPFSTDGRCKRVYRSLRSASIRVAVKKRQLRLTSGRMRSALASLLVTQRSSFLYDTLLCEDGSSMRTQ